ncbi:metallophosphoesterase family protein [Pontiella sulfatireligans]|uniref:Alkaline phosphatase n=1 Tax=Pontiella sulfatireligans TaxID=2750658 RepID=A0A6C2UNC5_9BACT|nr:metallophosphoesterase [Pontiella sulfatireligans]VGO20824.1 Alkaline phosphatase [Pontiella sulfatireligans]
MYQISLIYLHVSKRWRPAALALFTAIILAASGAVAATQGVTVAVTADVFMPDVQVVSDVIMANPSVSAVLLAGDTSNDKTTPVESYREIYKGTYDRFISKIYPCPGNHDAKSEPPFSGYCEFWGEAAHAPEMYYSFDLGGWHVVSLDSVTFVVGGEKADAQLDWLKKDLAANPRAPTLAYWHYPLFSNAKHGGYPKMKPLWDVLYAHGPALVMTGHNHVYERFAPMNSVGERVPETEGIQEFLICPGGARTVNNESKETSGPRSEKFEGGTQHVGFFTLFPNGAFSYDILSVSSKGATEVVDKGAGNLLGGPIPAGN